MTAIAIERLSLRYPHTGADVLHEVSLHLSEPRIVGLFGRNGAGKTSLLSVLAAFRKPTAGQVLLDGAPVWENSENTRRICFIRGGGDTVEHNWPEDRVADALAVANMLRPNWSAERAAELIAKFGLPQRTRLSELSTGQRSALGVVLGLAARAPVTIFDESHLGMDAPSRRMFYDELLREYTENPRTFILSSHLIDEVGPLLEDVVILHEGRILLHEEAETLRGQGAAVTGPVDRVDAFVAGLRVLDQQQLGSTKRATVHGALDDGHLGAARAAGVVVEPLALQDLFIHLTASEGDRK
ncbi:ATP-binding cassette domain-containing protein [Nocardia crassostreae]|uniref:ATP-binding cassette domain-containing protein n=1 Tax=Nocardia crassostreae TaxID=53428 RepID=UPI000832BCAC|nr:ABC transporter ATP-binding protein [Nocardia crassostreae]